MAGNLAETTTCESPKVEGVIGRDYIATLSGTLTLDGTYGDVLKLDPGGAGRTVLLWPEATRKGVLVWIINAADAAETLTVKEDSNTTTIGSVAQNKTGLFYCDGTNWTLLYTFTTTA